MPTIKDTFDIIRKWYVVNYPEGTFPWDDTLTFTLYNVYVVTMIALFKKK